MQPQLQSSFPLAPFPQPRPQAPILPIPSHHASKDLAINGIVEALNDLQLEVVNMKNRANRPPRDHANVVYHGCNQKGHYKNKCPNGPRLNLLGESDMEDSDIEVLNLGK